VNFSTWKEGSFVRPGLIAAVARLDISPALLGLLFGPPGPPVGNSSSGAYRFVGEKGELVQIFDERLTREVTGSAEQRPASELWSSTESWVLEVGTQVPTVLPEFFSWLAGVIQVRSRAEVEAEIAAGDLLLQRGEIKEARRKLWAATARLSLDPKLSSPLTEALAAFKQRIARAASPLFHPRATFTFHYGQANAPDSRGGQDSLTMFLDGRLALTVQQGARSKKWTARTDPTLIARFRDVLLEVGFPDIPMGVLAPGVSSWEVGVETPDQRLTAIFCTNPYRRQAPHRDLFAIGTGLCAKIRNDPNAGLSDSYGVTVTEVQALP
jgi:hypothetical protein